MHWPPRLIGRGEVHRGRKRGESDVVPERCWQRALIMSHGRVRMGREADELDAVVCEGGSTSGKRDGTRIRAQRIGYIWRLREVGTRGAWRAEAFLRCPWPALGRNICKQSEREKRKEMRGYLPYIVYQIDCALSTCPFVVLADPFGIMHVSTRLSKTKRRVRGSSLFI